MSRAQTSTTPVAEWRQPAPRPAPIGSAILPPNGRRARLGSALANVFERSEDENRRQILALAAKGTPRARLLDLGCFNGAFTTELAKAARASQTQGVEYVPEHAAQARARGITVVEADLNEPLPFPDESFDLVHANQLIEHLRNTDRFLHELRRITAAKGAVILSTNNLASWHNVFSLVLGFQPLPAHVSDEVHVGNPLDPRRGARHADAGQTHLRIFTTRALKELAAEHGLTTTATRLNGYYPLTPRAARLAARIDPTHAAFIVLELTPTP
jgi:methionine biosynthesis protein MetW